MQYGLFSYAYSNNVGDEIQSIAASQFLPQVDQLIERDRLQWYCNIPETFTIFNGWFPPEVIQWPPPANIHPLFVSFYPTRPDAIINEQHKEYFRKYEPIGCRSLATVECFHRIGIDAYFSGCLTLTLPQRHCEKTNEIYAVDIDGEINLFKRLVPARICEKAIYVSHEFFSPNQKLIKKTGWKIADFVMRAINRIDRPHRHFHDLHNKYNLIRHNIRTDMANDLLNCYAQAKLVITSRLHCALPCLAIGTPVLLIRSDIKKDPRFAGLKDLVRHYGDQDEKIDIDWDRPDPNRDDFKKYSTKLHDRCRNAVQNIQKSK